MKRRSQTNFSSKQNQELVWGEREERVGGRGYQPAEEPFAVDAPMKTCINVACSKGRSLTAKDNP